MGDSLVQQQNRKRDDIARSHVDKVAESLNEMRKVGLHCDCTLEVERWGRKVSSQVNYAVVSAASEYCRSNSRCENGKWTVEVDLGGQLHETETMKKALEQCIEFMYIGKADIRDDTAGCIAMISYNLQLKLLEDMGLETMRGNLSTWQNCCRLLVVARDCKRKEYEAEAIKKWISLNLQQIPGLNECSPKNLWKSAADLLENSFKFKCMCKILNVLKLIEIEKADCKFLLDVVMTNEEVTKDSAAAKYVFETICQKINRQPSNLNCGNYYKVKNLLVRYESDTPVLKVRLENLMISDFDVLIQQDGFLETKQYEVTSIFSSPQLTCTEKIKFDSMVKWAKHEPEERAQTFPKLFKLIKLENLSEKELIDIKKDPLVESNASLVSSVFDALAKKRETLLSQLHDLPYTAQWLLTQLQTQECDNDSIASSRSQRTRTSKSRKLPSKVSNFSTASFLQHTTSQISNFSTASLREDLLSLETSSDTEAEVYDRAYFSEKSDN